MAVKFRREEVHQSWELVHKIKDSASLEERWREFSQALMRQFSPEMVSVWLLNEGKWVNEFMEGLTPSHLEGTVAELLGMWRKFTGDKEEMRLASGEAGTIYSFPLSEGKTLLGVCLFYVSENIEKSVQRKMAAWVGHFVWLFSIYVAQEKERRRFIEQEVALNLLLNGSNILNRAGNEKQLIQEAGEMAMGILGLEKGIFVLQDALDPERIQVQGFGRLRHIDSYVDMKYWLKRTDLPCTFGDGKVTGCCSECKLYKEICQALEEAGCRSLHFTKYALQVQGKTVGELRLLHYEDELGNVGQPIIRTFVGQISIGLEILRNRFTLERLARYDPLTGLLNRQGLEERLEEECLRAKRNKEHLLFILMDLDHFKQVNDTLGHPVGDEVLIRFGQLLQKHVRPYDLVARLGGDEFVMVLPSWPDTLESAKRVQQWMTEIEHSLPDVGVKIGLSAGVARFPEQDNFRNLYQQADETLYHAKRLGRHRIYGLLPEDQGQINTNEYSRLSYS